MSNLACTEKELKPALREDCSLLGIRAERFFKELEGYLTIATDIKRTEIVEYCRNTSETVIFIDYFGILSSDHTTLEDIAGDLKRMARETGKLIVVLSQRTRDTGLIRNSPKLQEVSTPIIFLEKSSITYESFVAINVIVSKNRNGQAAVPGFPFRVGNIGNFQYLLKGDSYKIFGSTDYKDTVAEWKKTKKAFMPDWKSLKPIH